MKSKPHMYTAEQEKFLFDNISNRPYQELADLFNQTFGTQIKLVNLKAKCNRMKINNGFDGRFVKGQEAWNKGMKGLYTGGESGWFKKGIKGPTNLPVGSERIDSDGFIRVKVKDESYAKDNWKWKHHLLWEHHNGPIPEDYLVIFLDGDPQNVTIENLILIDRNTHMRLNQKHMRFENAELTKAAVAITKLDTAIREISKGDVRDA